MISALKCRDVPILHHEGHEACEVKKYNYFYSSACFLVFFVVKNRNLWHQTAAKDASARSLYNEKQFKKTAEKRKWL
jgi:hypothetical protein